MRKLDDNFNDENLFDNGDYFIKIDDMDDTANHMEDYYMKLDGEEIIKEEKRENQLDIMEDILKENEEDIETIPHYNSPEYSDYLSKINKEGLKEIAMEEINNDDLAFKVQNKAKEKYSNEQIKKFMSVSIIVLFVAIIITIMFMMKGLGSKEDVNTVLTGDKNKILSEFDFVANVVATSNNNSKDNYDILKECSLSIDDTNKSLYKSKIEEVINSAKYDLEEVQLIKDYVNIKNYEEIKKLLELRYNNIIELAQNILNKSTNLKEEYNKYAKTEIEIINSLNKELGEKLELLNIPYTITEEGIKIEN